MTQREWAAFLGINPATLTERLQKWPLEKALATHGKAKRAINGWSNGYGYRQTSVGGRRKLEHVAIAEAALGKALPKGSHVHHVDYNPSNNSRGNLVVCPDAAYHKLLHVRTDAYRACGNPTWRRCAGCKHHFDPAGMRHAPSSRVFRCRPCARAYDAETTRRRREAASVAGGANAAVKASSGRVEGQAAPIQSQGDQA